MNKLFTLFTLLLLLPLAARAAAPSTLTVGGTDVLSGSYWLTNADDGTLTDEGASADNYNVYYDGDGTLTLKDATINGTDIIGHVGAGIFASGDLTIVLEGSSTVKGVQDPNGETQSIRVEGNLTIQGGGSLTAQGAETSSGSSYGIFVIGSFTQQGGSVTASGGNINGNYTSRGLYVSGSTVTVEGGTLTATGGNTSGNSYGIYAGGSVTVGSAAVTATGGTGNYSYGLYVYSSSTSVTLSGGSLTARSGSGTDTAVGIYLNNPRGSTGSVTVGNGSTLLANSVILYDNSFTEKPLAPTGDGSWLIYGQSNQPSAVGGSYTLEENITIPEDVTLTIPSGSTLTVPTGVTLTVDGTLNIANQSSLAGEGTLEAGENSTFNLTNPDPVISGDTELTYDGTDQFDEFKLEAPTGTVEVMEKNFAISDTPSLDGWSLETQVIKDAGTYTLTARNTDGSRTVQKQVTVKPAEISITGATLTPKTYDGTTDATVESVTFNGDVQPTANDYTVTATFTDANAGESKNATVTVTLKNGNYTFADNQDEATYDSATGTISPLHVVLEWDYQSPFTYNGETHVVTATVTNMVGEDEITLTYEGNTGTAVSSYTAKVTGLDNTNYTLEGVENTTLNWEIVGASIADATVELSETTFTYNGSAQQPTVTVKLGDKILTENTDYTVDYSDKSINAGEYTVTVTGTGNYSGTVTATYTINKADQAALSITSNGPATYGQNYTLTTSGGSGDGAVIFTVTDETGAATVNDNILTPTKAGSVTVTATKAGDNNYNDGTSVSATITINKGTYDGTTTATGSVLANWPGEVELPGLPDGASYGEPSSNDVTGMSITGGVLHYTGGSGIQANQQYTVTVPVAGATNYNDYQITVTLTGKEIVTVEAVGSENPSFSTTQDRFTLTATVSGEKLSENPDCWTWDIADKTVADFIDSPTTRSMSVSDSRTFEIKGPGTTTITATYDDGKYHGSVIFSVSISKPTTPDPQPAIYNIYVEDVCDGVEVSTSKQAVKEGGSIIVYVEKDTAHYTFDNFHVYYKEGYYGPWVELPEGVQSGEYPIKNIWNHIYIKAEGAEEKEDPTGIEQIEGVKVYTKDGSLYVQTPQREQVIIVSMSGAVVKNEEQIGLKQYHGLQPGIYIVRVGDRAYKLRLH